MLLDQLVLQCRRCQPFYQNQLEHNALKNGDKYNKWKAPLT